MKRISFFLALALTIASFGIASANSVSFESISGDTWPDGAVTKLIPGGNVTISLRLTSTNAFKTGGVANGFVFSVDGGAGTFAPIVTTVDPTFAAGFDIIWAVNEFSVDGTGLDTVGLGGASLGGAGLAAGYDDVPYSFATGGVADGSTLCIDSTFYPPSGTWLWAAGANGDFVPTWDGPHCWISETPACLAPDFSALPLSLSGSHCDVMTQDFGVVLNPVNIPLGSLVYSADIGTIDGNGMWSYAPSLADVGTSMAVTITVGNGTCSGDHVVNLTFTNEAPVITCPATTDVSTTSSNDFTATATDDCDGISFSIGAVTGDVVATIADPNVGDIVVVAGTTAGPYTVEVIADDGNASSSCTYGGNVIAGSLFQVEIPCFGAPEGPVFQGQHVSIPVILNNKTIDGYDLLIGYDNSALSFQSAAAGADLLADGWEYFTYRYGANGNCSNACPSGLLRLTAIAETNNGPNHPTIDGVSELAVLDFLVTNDRTFECQEIPVRFYWMDCGDNALSTDQGTQLHVSEIVYDGDEVLSPPNGTEIQDGTYGFPTYFGSQDECIIPVVGKPTPIRDVSFNNGCVFIACADAIDARGDINLNNVANEIADAVLYSNYFIYGLGTFNVNTEGQIAASDVNADGLALSVADLVYLIRIVVGDALPYPKLAPISASIVNNNGIISVDADMGAAFVVIEGNVTAELLVNNMTLESNFDGVNTRVLVYSLEGNSFAGEFLNVNGNIVSIELGSIEGATVNAKLIPANFELAQNYPNPFNPSTTVGFSIPVKSNVTLTIYNVTGQKVADFSDSYEAGVHSIEWDASAMASGIYFYRLDTGNFSETKKMVLLK